MAAASKGLWHYAMLAMGGLLLYMVLVKEQWLVHVIDAERVQNHHYYTNGLADASEARANRWFNGVFVHTGVMAATFEPFIPSEDEKRRSKGLEDLASPTFAWFEQRLRASWMVIWQATLRLSNLLLWAPYALILILPWAVDGYVLRKIKQHSFAFTSPLQHRYSVYAIQFIIAGYVLLLVAPLPLSPVTTPLLMLLTGVLLQRVMANFMKRA